MSRVRAYITFVAIGSFVLQTHLHWAAYRFLIRLDLGELLQIGWMDREPFLTTNGSEEIPK